MTWSVELTDPTARTAQHAPDAALAARDGQRTGASCALWWRETPQLDGHHVGAIGHYEASDEHAAVALLAEACRLLTERGCRVAVGPMDGNTWQKYRFVVEHGSEPPFLMEPANPKSWPTHFASAGFSPLAYYFSALNTDLSVRDARLPTLQSRFADREVTLRALRMDDFAGELQRIYAVAEHAFADNVLYTPVSFDQFASQYQASAAVVVPELVIIAEQHGRPVGFSFSIPDLLERQRISEPRTIILKTVAVLPDRTRFNGLGALMIDATHVAARQLGFARVIHALMHESNQSLRISAGTAMPIRRYALFARPLAPMRT